MNIRACFIRYRQGHLTAADGDLIFLLFAVPYGLLMLYGLVCFDAEDSDKVSHWHLLFWGVSLFLWFGLIMHIRSRFSNFYRTDWFGHSCGALLAACAAFPTIGLMNIINAMDDRRSCGLISAPISSVIQRSGGWAGQRSMVTFELNGRPVRWGVSKEEYRAAQASGVVELRVCTGLLGYSYRRGIAFWR
jgi:hypothetical protein